MVEEGADKPIAFGVFFLTADKNCAAGAVGKGREAAVVTSFLVRHKRKFKVKSEKLKGVFSF